MRVTTLALVFSTGPISVLATAAYIVKDTFIGPSFLTGFNHEAIPDPTWGRVNYVTQSVAQAQNLTFVSSDTLVLRADYTTTLPSGGAGRNSVRLISKKQWSTSVTVLNVRHMPVGCGTWPAFWTTSNTVAWPNAGEIDILEGVNDVGPNFSTLHTTDGCTMSSSNMVQTGWLNHANCFYGVNYNSGCSVGNNKPNSYGNELNNVGGGWYAMERTPTTIKVWFWARNEPTSMIPADIRNGAATVYPAHWGKPYASFNNAGCDLSQKFGPNNIIINLTLCGDWAGNPYVYPSSCPQSCVDHVNNHPAAFKDSYWDIASVRVYEPKTHVTCSNGQQVLGKRDNEDCA